MKSAGIMKSQNLSRNLYMYPVVCRGVPIKSSLFNVFVPAKKGYALYNTMSSSVLFCDEELKHVLESNDLSTLQPEYVTALKKVGCIVEDTDEHSMFQYRYDSKAFDTKKTQCIVITTYKCNLACPYCYEGKGEVYSKEMDFEMAEKVMKAMQNRILQSHSRFFTLILFGGEPLLNTEVGLTIAERMGAWCGNQGVGMRTFMVTNGTLLTPEMASALQGVVNAVQITLDGSQPFHDKTRVYKNGRGTYNEVVNGIRAALEAGMDVSLRIQIHKDNCSSLDRLFGDIQSILRSGRVNVNIAPLSQYSGLCSHFSSHFLDREEQEKVLPALLHYSPNLQPAPNLLPCVAFTNNWIFDGAGNIYKCITTVGEKRVGYLTDKGSVWEPELYDFMGRSPLKVQGCSTCPYLPLCGGGCPREAFLTHHTYESSVCGGSRKVYSEMISTYLKKRFPERF